MRFVVNQVLDGNGDQIKEYLVGVEAFGRPDSYDPRTDPVVRVEARRLRSKLEEYYAAEGSQDEIRIDIPKGSYAPTFSWNRPIEPKAPNPEENTTARKPQRAWNIKVAVPVLCAIVIILCVAAYQAIRPKPKDHRITSIAVLPFLNLGNAENEYFTDGLVDELTTVLAQLKGLRVVARTSAFQFRDKNPDIREVGRRLGVEKVIEGSVQKTGDRIRINIQLINTVDGFHLWSNTFNRNARDIFAVQDEVTRAIAKALELQLSGKMPALEKRVARNLEAYNLYLKGRYFINKIVLTDVRRGIQYLEEAVRADPDYGPAHAALADGYATMAFREVRADPEMITKAKAAAAQALKLDGNLAEAHAVLAWIEYFYDWDWDCSEQGLLRALAIDPNSSRIHDMYSQVLMSASRFDEAIAESKKALALDPINNKICVTLAVIYYLAGRYDDAVRQSKLVLEMNPHYSLAHTVIGVSYIEKRMYPQAREALRKSLEENPQDADTMAHLSIVEHYLGNDTESLRWSNRIESIVPKAWYHLSHVYALRGEKDRAFDALAKCCRERNSDITVLNVDPAFASLRSDPRYADFKKKLGWLQITDSRKPSSAACRIST